MLPRVTLPDPYATSAAPSMLDREQRRQVRPHRLWFLVGAALVLLGAALFARLTPAFIEDVKKPVQPLSSSVEAHVNLEEPGQYYLMTESAEAVGEPMLIVPCDITAAASGLPLAVRTLGPATFTLRQGRESYQAFASFRANPGEYTIRCKLSPQRQVVLARDPFDHRSDFGAGLLLGLLFGGTGLLTLIVTAVRRSKSEQRLLAGASARPSMTP